VTDVVPLNLDFVGIIEPRLFRPSSV